MIIALDYDGTFTTDPTLWLHFIKLVKSRNHVLVLVTGRYPEEGQDIFRQLNGKVDDTIFTSGKAKKAFCEFHGIHIDIWIDDQPQWIFNSSGETLTWS